MTTWTAVLDSIAAQLDLQRSAVARGLAAPPDLEIFPPDVPLDDPHERLRALALLDESEFVADLVVNYLVAAPLRGARPYGRRARP